jgi:selenocysteine-specific elongation factor
LRDALVIALPHWNQLRDKTLQLVETHHANYPLRRGIPREELKSKLKLTPRVFNALVNKLLTDHWITEYSAFIAKPGHTIKFNGQEQAKVQALMRKFEANPFSPPSVKDCISEAGEEVLSALVELNELIAVSTDVIFRKRDYDLMMSKINNAIMQNNRISLAEVRDLFSTSRKYAQALLEHLDARGVTTRDGDFRKLKKP